MSNTAKSTPTPTESHTPAVYRTKHGKSYHRAVCRYAKDGKAITMGEAKIHKLTACKVCHADKSEAELAKVVTPKAVKYYTACAICLKSLKFNVGMTAELVAQKGYKLTKTGVKYHSADCKHAGGKGVKVAAKTETPVLAPASKPRLSRSSQPVVNA